jgi:hypothetical protein
MPAPRGLSPEEVMALFPSSHSEREILDTPAVSSPSAAALLPAMSAPLSQAAVSPTVPEPQDAPPIAQPVSPAGSPTPDQDKPAAVASLMPAKRGPVSPTAGGQPPRGMRALGAEAPSNPAAISIDLRQDDIVPPTYNPGDVLAANPELAKMLVPDGRLMTLWLEIDAVEADVATIHGMSQEVAGEMLDRLMKARNLLMNDRAQFEESARQVAQVKYRLAHFRSSTVFQTPLLISLYLLAFLVLVIAGVPFSRTIAWDQLQIMNLKLDMLWFTMLVGGIGGFTGAAYSLVTHVARDQDYDPQFALWYYQNPWMGLVLGIFVYIAVYILMNIGSLMMNETTTSGSSVFVLVTFFFAWLAGFKHNIAFDLADTVLKKLIPAQDDGASADSGNSGKPPAQK